MLQRFQLPLSGSLPTSEAGSLLASTSSFQLPLSGSHPEGGLEGRAPEGTFNSLSRDHSSSCSVTGSPAKTLSTPSLGITWRYSRCKRSEGSFNSLSRDHLENFIAVAIAADTTFPFNSLSRDHSLMS